MDKNKIDWNAQDVRDMLTTIKAYTTRTDGQDGGIINITQNVLPDFGDDYEKISQDWYDTCPAPVDEFCTKKFICGLLNGDADKVEKLENYARDFYVKVMDFAEKAREKLDKENLLPPFTWVAHSNDDCYNVESERSFSTLKECYNDMRNAALEKAKWNTEFDEDFEEGVPIGYEFKFHPLCIVHSSFSGVYTYRVRGANGKCASVADMDIAML